jgi:phosphoribosylformimino-5-aminoimidazole carboxamide ribotide isomerase
MDVIPAIDIRGGKCVRLYQGDFARETVYSDDPLSVAARWVEMGASRIHVVDLDGAKSGSPVNLGLVAGIASSVPALVQFGGGIRTLDVAREAIALGVSRVVIGTAAVEGPGLVEEACRELGPETVAVGVDVRDGYVAVRGWTEKSRISATELIARIEAMGVRRFVHTDIARDATLTEPNLAAIEDLGSKSEMKMIVAGGISSVAHLLRLSELGVEAAIVGKAIYTGDIDLREAIDSVGSSKTDAR